jgi:hypothetical protein
MSLIVVVLLSYTHRDDIAQHKSDGSLSKGCRVVWQVV